MGNTRKTAESIAFGRRLREARLKSRYPQRADLAKKTGINQNTIADYENGLHYPHAQGLAKLCSVLEVDAPWLYGLEDRPQNDPLDKPRGRHEAAYAPAGNKEKRRTEAGGSKPGNAAPAEAGPREAGKEANLPGNMAELIDLIDNIHPTMQSFLMKGEAIRAALHDDPTKDHASEYIVMLCSKPCITSYYFDRRYMHELEQSGVISDTDYEDWMTGRKERMKKIPLGPAADCPAEPAARPARPVLKCTSEEQ